MGAQEGKPEYFIEYPENYIFPHQINNKGQWDNIKSQLQSLKKNGVKSAMELSKSISNLIQYRYNSEEIRILKNLPTFLNTNPKLANEEFYKKIVPMIAGLALEVEVETGEISYPYLSQNKQEEVILSRRLVAILMSHAFFCTNIPQGGDKLYDNPLPAYHLGNVQTKLKFFFNYFWYIYKTGDLGGYITIKRFSLKPEEVKAVENNIYINKGILQEVELVSEGDIFEFHNCIQVDFANEYIGGITLFEDSGTQEDLIFGIMPECLVSVMFNDKMLGHESILISGHKYISEYSGYGYTFAYEGDYNDPLTNERHDHRGRINRQLTAIDAIPFHNYLSQFTLENIRRELIKCYIGFIGEEEKGEEDIGDLGDEKNIECVECVENIKNIEAKTNHKKRIATGRWGCGAFNGDSPLKFIIQWIAASANRRKMVFIAFNTDPKMRRIPLVVQKCKHWTISHMYSILFQFAASLQANPNVDLFTFILKEE